MTANENKISEMIISPVATYFDLGANKWVIKKNETIRKNKISKDDRCHFEAYTFQLTEILFQNIDSKQLGSNLKD